MNAVEKRRRRRQRQMHKMQMHFIKNDAQKSLKAFDDSPRKERKELN